MVIIVIAEKIIVLHRNQSGQRKTERQREVSI